MALIQPGGALRTVLSRQASRPCQMIPVQIGGAAGWLHMPVGGSAAVGAVLCPALGREARWSYRALRQLADRLAATGMPALRIDYPGTGNAADLPEWEEPLTAWREAVHGAADWLRACIGVERLVLCGLRFGALLAADVASARGDVAAVALLSPVLSGRAYARELRMTAMAAADSAGAGGEQIELDGLVLAAAALQSLGAVDLMRMERGPAPAVLVMDNTPRTLDYAERLRGQGTPTVRVAFPGQDEMLRVATSNATPHQAWDVLANWAADLAEAAGALPGDPRPIPPAPFLQSAGWRERPVQFGAAHALAGIMCEPSPCQGERQAVLIPNTGGDPAAGIARFGVTLARALAARGIASLRFDFAGLGDSRLPGDQDCHLYETDRSGDIGAALLVLSDAGYTELGGAGVCTGAYHLLKAAETERRLRRLACINLVTFQWREGDTLEVAQLALGRSSGSYKELAWRPATWLRVLRGSVDVRHVARTLSQRAAQRVMRPLSRFGVGAAQYSPRRAVLRMLASGSRLLFLCGFEDPGVAALEAQFGPGGRDLRRVPGAAVQIARGIDHTLSQRGMQERVAVAVAEFLQPSCPGG